MAQRRAQGPVPSPVVEDSIQGILGGDFSQAERSLLYEIGGADTLGRPTTGYRYTPERTPFYTYLVNTSGWNESINSDGGRTAAVAYRTRIFQSGQGDAVAYNASVFVRGTREGSTSFLANPAGSILNGDMFAGDDGVYLNAGEFLLRDLGRDAAAVGWVVNLDRRNATGAKQVYWAGFRAQGIGTQPADAAFSSFGRFRTGLDTTVAEIPPDGAAVAVRAGQRIALAAVPRDYRGMADAGQVFVQATSGLGITLSAPGPISIGGDKAGIIVNAHRAGGVVLGTSSGPLRLSPAGTAVVFPQATADPAEAEDGSMYYNTVMHKLRLRVDGAWTSL